MRKQDFIRLKNVSSSSEIGGGLRDVSIDLYESEIHALMGDDPSGICLLSEVLCGARLPGGGSVYYKENEKSREAAAEFLKENARKVGYQDELINGISVAENIFLFNKNGCPHPWISPKNLRIKTLVVFRRLGIDGIVPKEMPDKLSAYQKRLVLIAKAISSNPRLLILENITMGLHILEAEKIISMIEELKGQGITILMVTDRADAVARVADRLSIMKDGVIAMTTTVKGKTAYQLAQLLNRNERKTTKPFKPTGRKEALRLENFRIGTYENFGFTLFEGEVLWMTGRLNATLKDVAQILSGTPGYQEGKIFLSGTEVKLNSVADAVKLKIGYLPGNDLSSILMREESVAHNIMLNRLGKKGETLINYNIEKYICREWKEKLGISASDSKICDTLDELQQKKVVLARYLAAWPKIMVINDLDMGMGGQLKELLMENIKPFLKEGAAVLVLANEMHNMFRYADRILVMSGSNICGEIGGVHNDEMMMLDRLET